MSASAIIEVKKDFSEELKVFYGHFD